MKIKNKKDLGLGIFCILLAGWITSMALQLRATGYEGDPGPKMFPIMGAVIIAVCGIGLIIAPEKQSKKFLTGQQWKAALSLFAVYIGFTVLFWLFGFIVTVPITLFVLTLMLSKLSMSDASLKKRLITSLIFGIVFGAVLYLAYVVGLGAKMPKGLVWTLLKK